MRDLPFAAWAAVHLDAAIDGLSASPALPAPLARRLIARGEGFGGSPDTRAGRCRPSPRCSTTSANPS